MGCTSTCFYNYSFISVTLHVDELKEKFTVIFAFRIARVIFLSLAESMFSSSFRVVMSCITCKVSDDALGMDQLRFVLLPGYTTVRYRKIGSVILYTLGIHQGCHLLGRAQHFCCM